MSKKYEQIPEMAQRRSADTSFTPIPDWVFFHPDLGQVDFCVYLALSSFADNETGQCHPGQKSIMSRARVRDPRTLWQSLSRLCAIGAVHIDQSDGNRNVYTLLDRCLSTSDDKSDRGAAQGGAQ